ncbi:ABC transporter substrate-binding protein [Actinophytocola algeriensis]|uniref:Raffinose/stachyose/melibiose transport system substrate-binding protein n=1 Tax=Actinophytocola algeriensis TaxID=1768010 RepID=A0A7W7VIE5_9PSEU|nr:extracellular solute-binding protein [Actinophytocola algeriensis]MBB4910995.1 raffinose/stachyose/melibiose transport system substrate-binding protein [Actinophytocola algeriensis]MBE1473988.1 raffinose/stachyose/melibiose transport system substrate-binding protein [Actinophytocola algeriensis]
MNPTRRTVLAAALGTALAITACSPGDLGSSDSEGRTTITFLVDNSDASVRPAEGLAEAFMADHPDVVIEVEVRPQGGEGDNVVKTRLSTGDMADMFLYNSGSLLQALKPRETLLPLNDEPFVDRLDETFTPTVSSGDRIFGAPFGAAVGGGVLYNRAVYDRIGLAVPKTWTEFMANNAKIKAAGVAPVVQTYQDTWTSQLWVLADFHNVAAAEPDFADRYTANQTSYATSPAALQGFRHLQEIHDAGYLNADFAAQKYEDGLEELATGKGAHYPILTFVIGTLETNNPGEVDDVGLFAVPGADAAENGLTVWLPGGVYVPTTTEGAELAAVKEFLDFVASPAGCDVQTKAYAPTGPYVVDGCELPADLPRAIQDMLPYFDTDGARTPALEFVSPVKGPALEQITVEVGSGIRSAEDGAALYDRDVAKQAKQLGLPGW